MAWDPNDVAATPAHAAFLLRARGVADEVDDDQRRALDRIDETVRRRLHPSSSDRLTNDVAAVARAAQIDLDVPTDSRIAVGRGVKTGVKKLVRWYVDPLGHQVAVLGGAVTSFAGATSAEVDRLEAELASLRAEVDELRARLGADDPESESATDPGTADGRAEP